MWLDERPPLLKLGGEEAFENYQREFNRLYHSEAVADVLGRTVQFPRGACRHVCFTPSGPDLYHRLARDVWSQDRAERIGWIIFTLRDPQELRPDREPGREIYLLTIPANPAEGQPQERFGVVVERAGPKRAAFCTAFIMSEPYWTQAKQWGPRIYPEPKPKKRKRR